MAEEDAAAGEEAGPSKPKHKLNPFVIVAVANTVFAAAAVGTAVYTKLIYQRPPIVEKAELQKKKDELSRSVAPAERSIVTFEQMTLNLAMATEKSRYITVAFAVECRDAEVAKMVEARKAKFQDKVIAAVGKREVTELNTIQGKLLLKTELLRQFDGITMPGGITDIYFSNFILQ